MDRFIHRDISWLYFNERVLEQALREDVPILERLKFLAIFSSNLDEFYRVRVPVLHGLRRLKKKQNRGMKKLNDDVYKQVKKIIGRQQTKFGNIISQHIIPSLKAKEIYLFYNEGIPRQFYTEVEHYFEDYLLPNLQITTLEHLSFFPVNNILYYLVVGSAGTMHVVNLSNIPRFFHIKHAGGDYVFFIDDILKAFLPNALQLNGAQGIYTFKVTRDADLTVDEGLGIDIASALEKELAKRDFGLATRLLYQSDFPVDRLTTLLKTIGLKKSSAVRGGTYHNLKDFFSFPVKRGELLYPHREPISLIAVDLSIFEMIERGSLLLHTPYQSYETVVRFFDESAKDPEVNALYTSIYRIAEDSRIGHALLKAAQNGKRVYVFVELKARFDETNNIQWAKRLAEAGATVTYSIPHLKVHAKVGLIEREEHGNTTYYGLISTGNLNESTAKIYTDHSLLTKDKDVTADLRALFGFLQERRVKKQPNEIIFRNLLVSHFNLLDAFKMLIDEEITLARTGERGHIMIKLNNIEDEEMITKLYEASQAGVQVDLIVRSICRIVPGVPGLSDNIRIKRIVGRYLEHSRIFYFRNGGKEHLFIGSSDWMVRNLHHRIEVCVPIQNATHKQELKEYLRLQWEDRISAVAIASDGGNMTLANSAGVPVQDVIQNWLDSSAKK
jgi:polyphosphate kinase